MHLPDFLEFKEFVDSLTAVDDGARADYERDKALAANKK